MAPTDLKIISLIDPFAAYRRLKSFYKQSNGRSRLIAVNIMYGGIAKCLAFLVGLLQISLTLSLVSSLEYGVWLTLYSFIGWFSFFDVGLGNGLRNKLTQALALQRRAEAKRYVSTTYAALGVIFGTLTLAAVFVVRYIDWHTLLNTGTDFRSDLWQIALVAFAGLLLNFIANLIHTVLAAFQKTGVSSFLLLLHQVIVLLLSYGLRFYTSSPLLPLVIILSITPLAVNLLSTFWLFRQSAFSDIRPAIRYFDPSALKEVLQLGYQFFVVQVAAVVLFSTDSFIISQLFTPAQVTPYFLAYKYFSLVSVGFSVLSPPLWSGFSHAFALRDMAWIRRTMQKLFYLWFLTIPCLAVMVIFSNDFYALWFGQRVPIPFVLTVTLGIYTLVAVWNSILSVFVNGTGALKLQFRVAVAGAVLNIPLAIFLAKYTPLGLTGVPWATIFCQLIASVVLFYQYKQMVRV